MEKSKKKENEQSIFIQHILYSLALRNYAVFDVFNPKIQILEQHVFAEYQKKSWEKVKW